MKLAETKEVTITTVVDNYADVLLKSVPGMERRGPKEEPLLAEHGFSMHVRLGAEAREILLDAGYTKVTLHYNLPRLAIDPTKVDHVLIICGHLDHTAALTDFLQMAGKRVPVLVHSDAFLERWFVFSDGSEMGPWHENPQGWEEAGAEIVYLEQSYELCACCLVTGHVPRRTDFEGGVSTAYYGKEGGLVHDPINDDQAIVIRVEGKGLVGVAGCAHSGFVNTVLCAQEISGVKEVWAIVGNSHLGSARKEKIERTIAELKAIGPRLVMPAHCTGFVATHRFAAEMPDEFAVNAVGTRLTF